MNKKEFISTIAEKSNLTFTQAEAALTATFDVIQLAMIGEATIAINGFGSFGTKVREERKGRNPKTGEELLIPRAIVPFFKPGSLLKKSVNSPKE